MTMRMVLMVSSIACVALCCDPGWKEFKGKCYRLQNHPASWISHNLECLYEGGALASVHSEQDNDFVKQMARGQTIYLGGAAFGLDYTWSDRTDFGDYTNFKNRTESRPPPGKPCVKMVSSGKWEACCCAKPPVAAVCVREW